MFAYSFLLEKGFNAPRFLNTYTLVIQGGSQSAKFAGRSIVDLEWAVLANPDTVVSLLRKFRPGFVIPVSDFPLTRLLHVVSVCESILADLERPALLRPVSL